MIYFLKFKFGQKIVNSFSQTKIGVICACGAFLMWGVFPIYFKILENISPYELLAHRIIWSFIILLIVIFLLRLTKQVIKILKNRKNIFLLFVTSLLISSNWLIYIAAVVSGHIAETSLGYFINPLVNIFLGMIFLKEKLDNVQKIAIFLVLAALIQEVIHIGKIPYIALGLAFSFGFYGLLRKKVQVNAFAGLFIETALLTPIAVFYILVFVGFSQTAYFDNLSTASLLVISGPITVVPLLLFAASTARLKLSTVGFLQYLSPTVSFLLAIFIYNEALLMTRVITFILIWISLLIVTFNSILKSKGKDNV